MTHCCFAPLHRMYVCIYSKYRSCVYVSIRKGGHYVHTKYDPLLGQDDLKHLPVVIDLPSQSKISLRSWQPTA